MLMRKVEIDEDVYRRLMRIAVEKGFETAADAIAYLVEMYELVKVVGEIREMRR